VKKNVLLVAEDDLSDVMLLERAIHRTGGEFQMVRVANGEELIDYLKGAGTFCDRILYPEPQLVLLDLKLPRKDGFAVLKWRQSHVDGFRFPVVVFSSSSLPVDIERAYRLGANSYVVKPSAPERLEAMVRALQAWWMALNVRASVPFA